jgi:hypothetical protein
MTYRRVFETSNAQGKMGCRLQGPDARGASKKSFARFYLVIVSTVLLYGSDTWVVTRRMADLLTSFQPMPQAHYATAHSLCRYRERCVDQTDVGWVMEEALLLNLHPVMHYVLNRRNGLLIRYADNRPSTIDANIRTPAPIQLSGTSNTTSRYGV